MRGMLLIGAPGASNVTRFLGDFVVGVSVAVAAVTGFLGKCNLVPNTSDAASASKDSAAGVASE